MSQPKVGDTVSATYGVTPGPAMRTVEGQVVKVHDDGKLDLEIVHAGPAGEVEMDLRGVVQSHGPKDSRWPRWSPIEPAEKPKRRRSAAAASPQD